MSFVIKNVVGCLYRKGSRGGQSARVGGRRQAGQALSEYMIIVVLVSVTCIGVMQLYGATLRNQIAGMAVELSGENGDAANTAAIEKAKLAMAEAIKDNKIGLSKFTNQMKVGITDTPNETGKDAERH